MRRIVFLSGAADLREGGEFSLIDVIRKLKVTYEILCVCKSRGELSAALEKYGVEVLFCDLKWSRKFRYLFSQYIRLFYLYLRLKKLSLHLIYSNSGRINPFAVKLAKRLNIPLVTHIRDLFDQTAKDKYLFRYSDNIIGCSKIVADLVRKFNHKVVVIYNGVDPQKFSPLLKSAQDSLRKRLKLDGHFLIGIIGTIANKKGYFEFVEAAREISKVIAGAKFLIVGDTLPGKEYIFQELKKKVGEYKVEDKFIFTGFFSEIEKALASLDVLLFPPRYEAFGRVIIEAFACKIPVVSTYSGGPEEIIEDRKDGFLCKIGDIKAMAKAIIDLYNDKDLYATVSGNAYKKFLERFTIDKTVKEIKLVIEKTINQREQENYA